MKIIFFFPFFLSKAWNKKNIHESHCWNVSMRIPSILNFWERGKKKQKGDQLQTRKTKFVKIKLKNVRGNWCTECEIIKLMFFFIF